MLAALAAAAGSATWIAAAPPYSSADEAAHVDYAYQLWHGSLPDFDEGLRLQLDAGARPPVQWTAQHPPLTYAVLAPVVGPLVDEGRPVAAALAGRAVMAAFAVLATVASGWAARQLRGRRDAVAAAVPLVVAGNVWVLRLGAAVYNDILLVLLVTLLLGLTARWVRGPDPRGWLLGAWLVLPAACALTRLSGVPLAGLCVAVAGVAVALRSPRSLRSWLRAVGAPVAVAVLSSAWFYMRNLEQTGSLTGGRPEWAAEHLGRETATVGEVLASGSFWMLSFRQFGNAPGLANVANLVLFAAPAIVGTLAGVVALRRSRRGDGWRCVWLLGGLLVVAVLGVVLQQVIYQTTGGGANGRYLSVLVLPFALAVATGLAGRRRTAWLLVPWAVVSSADLALDLRAVANRYVDSGLAGLPPAWGWAAWAAHAVALVMCAVVLARAAARARTAEVPQPDPWVPRVAADPVTG